MRPVPIVYAGPSVPRREAAAALPGADLRPPIRRGDLYRDREAGGTVFLLLDGVFFQQEAVSPREVVDVVADGALVAGAASMGALRAAECWPAGMLGVGSIYRLFRRGLLSSDDEVAVAFAPGGEHELLSVPLINVRYALSRAVRQGWLAAAAARRIARTAEETFYTERDWPRLLADAGSPTELAPRLAAFDLKKMDALRALRRVARWLAADPARADRPRRGSSPFTPRAHTREPVYDPLDAAHASHASDTAGTAATAATADIRRDLARWLLLSGRGVRHLLAVAAAHPELRLGERLHAKTASGALVAALRPGSGGEIAAAAALQIALLELWRDLAADGGVWADGLWAELALSGELDAEILRRRAVREAAAAARQAGLAARDRDRYVAEMEIADAHGFAAWRELRAAVRRLNGPWAELVETRNELALAKRWREELFNPQGLRA